MSKLICVIFTLILTNANLFSQIDSIHFEEQSFVEYNGLFSAYSGAFDENDPTYLYAASMELGLKVFKIVDDELNEIATFPPSEFNNLHVSNLDQQGDQLYLSLGNFQALFGSSAGIAVLDVSDPEAISIEGQWSNTDFNRGSAIIKVEGDLAYLGMMDSGMAIINVANPDSMYYLSHLVPDYFFPSTPGLFTKPHTRGMAIRDDFAFLCADAGGLRVIDISDKMNPSEEAKYVNEYVFQNAGRAYNNILLNGDVAYVALDYCGLEVLDISDPLDPQLIALYDFWDCGNSPWEDGPGHTSEMVKFSNEDILLVSSGDTEILALDVSIPEDLKIIGSFGGHQDSVVAWGINRSGDKVALFQVDNSAVPESIPQPYYGEQGGVKLLSMDILTPTSQIEILDFKIFPNPFSEELKIVFPQEFFGSWQVKIFNQLGQVFITQNVEESTSTLNLNRLPKGIYFMTIESQNSVFTKTIVKY